VPEPPQRIAVKSSRLRFKSYDELNPWLLTQGALAVSPMTHGVDHASKLDDASVTGALDDATSMGGDGGVDHVATDAPKTRQRPLLVGSDEPAVAHDIRNQNRRELPVLAHARRPIVRGEHRSAIKTEYGLFLRIARMKFTHRSNEKRDLGVFGRIRP
jgi:hypothetical protein